AIAVSGPRDAIVDVDPRDPDRVLIARVGGGCELMPLVVGTGCSLAALTAAYLGAQPEDRFAAAVTAHAHFAAAGAEAARSSRGPGSFAVAFVAALHAVAQTELTAIDVTVTTVGRTRR